MADIERGVRGNAVANAPDSTRGVELGLIASPQKHLTKECTGLAHNDLGHLRFQRRITNGNMEYTGKYGIHQNHNKSGHNS